MRNKIHTIIILDQTIIGRIHNFIFFFFLLLQHFIFRVNITRVIIHYISNTSSLFDLILHNVCDKKKKYINIDNIYSFLFFLFFGILKT